MRNARLTLSAMAVALLIVVFPGMPAGAAGSDPGLPQQWGLRQIGATTSWDRGVLGGGSTVAVIDTGIDAAHEDLRGQIAAAVTCVNTQGDASRCTMGAADIQGHGTHVAGTAAAASNSVGVAGVAPEARIIAIRVFQEEIDTLTGETSYFAANTDINAGIRWVVANIKTKGSINLSFGGNLPVRNLDGNGFEVGIEEAWKAGWLPVLAAGNENLLGVAGSSNYGSLNAMVVGATGPDDELAEYSSPFGNAKWGIVAPGGNAESSDPEKSSCEVQPERCVLSTFKGGQYGLLQGTSMATPHVAGAAALLMGAGMTNSQAVQRLLEAANKNVRCGAGCKGRLDVAKATAGMGGASVPSATPGTAAPTPSSGASGTAAGGSSPSSPNSGPTTTASRRTVATTPPPSASPSQAATEPPAADVVAAPPAELGSPVPLEEPQNNDGFTDLSIEAAAAAADPTPKDDGAPGGAIASAVAALVGVAGATFLRWRRRPA